MKTIIKFTIALTILHTTGQLFAQHEKEIKNKELKGIYLNLDDFKQNKLTRPTDKQHKDDVIKLKQFFNSPDITIIENGVEHKYFKDSIFAIRLTNGENYRFINLDPCLIADTSCLYIYTHKAIRNEYKMSGPHRRAKKNHVTDYYFSFGNQNAVHMLTLENIRKYILIDTVAYNSISNKFKTDEMLTQINLQTGHFILNETILSVLKK
jgi:hypothetical protein